MNIRLPILLTVLTALAACAGEPPYVHRPYTIDRDLATFPDGPEINDGSAITICYAKSDATPEAIRALADEECAKGGLNARFVEQNYSSCPLLTPVTAVFNCTASFAGRGTQPATSPYIAAPVFEAPRPAGAGHGFGTIGAADVSTTAKSQPFPTYLFNNGQPTQ